MVRPSPVRKSFIVVSALIAGPDFRCASPISYWLCRFSQNWALVPKKCPSRKAVSPVIDRRPFNICVTRLVGTPSCRESSLRSCPSLSVLPLDARPGVSLSSFPLSVVIHNFHVRRAVGVYRPIKTNPPLIVNPDAILPLPISP
jgi:hypothetical protein